MKRSTRFLPRFFALALALAASLTISAARADRIRDLCDVVGVRDNQLLGYGIVTGLNGTGDDITAPLAQQSLLALMRRLGIQVDTGQLRLRNVAAVLVTATIPPFARPGAHLDVTVSSVGNARSLQGGVLLQTLLAGADMHIYAVAQGPLVIGGFEARGLSGSSVKQNAPNTGRVPGGALVEREIPMTFVREDGTILLGLHDADFSTAQKIVAAVDKEIGAGSAMALDSGAVKVKIPSASKGRPVELVAKLGALDVTPGAPARVVINERTGTIIAGGDVRLAPAAIAQGGLTIVIKETANVSQPNAPFTRGQTTVTAQSEVTPVEAPPGPSMTYLEGATSLTDVAQALATLGVNPRDLASILQALRTAGALRAEIVMQ
jgi:flagellar P-ring protein precursor FlgI